MYNVWHRDGHLIVYLSIDVIRQK